VQTQTHALIARLVTLYVTLFRGTPMLIQITFFYILAGRYFSAFTIAIIALGMNSAAYVSQIIKSGIQSVSYGQIEAAQTLGIKKSDIIRYIILPQAFSMVMPSLGNEFITLTKDTSLAYTIGVMELFMRARIVNSIYLDPIPIYIIVAGIYLVITISLSLIVNHIEKRISQHVRN
jgi:polar amino acid transport system permease protein